MGVRGPWALRWLPLVHASGFTFCGTQLGWDMGARRTQGGEVGGGSANKAGHPEVLVERQLWVLSFGSEKPYLGKWLTAPIGLFQPPFPAVREKPDFVRNQMCSWQIRKQVRTGERQAGA